MTSGLVLLLISTLMLGLVAAQQTGERREDPNREKQMNRDEEVRRLKADSRREGLAASAAAVNALPTGTRAEYRQEILEHTPQSRRVEGSVISADQPLGLQVPVQHERVTKVPIFKEAITQQPIYQKVVQPMVQKIIEQPVIVPVVDTIVKQPIVEKPIINRPVVEKQMTQDPGVQRAAILETGLRQPSVPLEIVPKPSSVGVLGQTEVHRTVGGGGPSLGLENTRRLTAVDAPVVSTRIVGQ